MPLSYISGHKKRCLKHLIIFTVLRLFSYTNFTPINQFYTNSKSNLNVFVDFCKLAKSLTNPVALRFVDFCRFLSKNRFCSDSYNQYMKKIINTYVKPLILLDFVKSSLIVLHQFYTNYKTLRYFSSFSISFSFSFSVTCTYIFMVVSMFECPSNFCRVFGRIPASMHLVA